MQKNIVVTFFKRVGSIIMGFTQPLTRAISRRMLSASMRKERKDSLQSMGVITKYKMWREGLSTGDKMITSNLLAIWLMWRKRSLTQHPYLNERPGGGSGVGRALQNWMFIAVMIYFLAPIFSTVGASPSQEEQLLSENEALQSMVTVIDVTPVTVGGINVPQPTPYPVQEITPTYTVTPEPTFTSTPEPTFTPSPTATVDMQSICIPRVVDGVQDGDKMTFGYSYYYPDLGFPSCHPDNWNGSTCADTTSSGLSWRAYLDKGGIAVPYGIPLMSTIIVKSPADLAGKYLAIDYCPCCAREGTSELWLDFLSSYQALPWASPVVVKIKFP